MRVTDSQCISLAFTDSQCISVTFMSGHFGYNNHILCGETTFCGAEASPDERFQCAWPGYEE